MSSIDPQSVSLLIEQAKEGCHSSKSELICLLQSFMQQVAGQCADLAHKHRVGESDLVQQSVMIVMKEFEGFRGTSQGELKAWLKQILVNQVRKNVRDLGRQKRDTKRERSIDYLQNGIHAGLVAGEPTPSTEAMRREQMVLMKSAISKLSDDHARVIQLRSFDRLPFTEISEQMDRSVEAVTKLWYRAILQLQKLMSENQ